MKKMFLLVFCMFFIALEGKIIQKTLSLFCIEEQVNGKIFGHQRELFNGIVKEVWTLDGKPIEQEFYLQELVKAEQEEFMKERLRQEHYLKEQQEFQDRCQKKIFDKLLKLTVKKVELELEKINDDRLKPFLLFQDDTVVSLAMLQQIIHEVSSAQQLFNCLDNKNEIKTTLALLEGYPEKLQKFYGATVDNAIATCNDTKLLRDLLELVS